MAGFHSSLTLRASFVTVRSGSKLPVEAMAAFRQLGQFALTASPLYEAL
jgi:hypothetical protein